MVVPCWQEIELAVDRESRVDNWTDKHPLYISSLADFEAPNLPFSELTHNGTTFSSRNYTFSVSSNIPVFVLFPCFLELSPSLQIVLRLKVREKELSL
ncbi:hypothetical protein SLE2022_251490 [Rubroshorea leprosula]